MKKILFLSIFFFTFFGCKDIDDQYLNEVSPQDKIKDFIWKGMNTYYLWQDEISDLADNRFENSLQKTNLAISENYRKFLSDFDSPQDFFEHLKHRSDRFSFIVPDYIALEKSFQGIERTTGMHFSILRINNNSNRLVSVVNYVVPNSPADIRGVRRGDIISRVNGFELNTENYRDLLFNGQANLVRFEFSNFDLQVIKSVDIEQVELIENPILIHKVIHQSGKKIGYLMYNSFVANFDLKLNEVFRDFKRKGISELILDLRYNSGGSVQTAIRLASMITGNYTGRIFVKQKTNSKIASVFSGDYPFENQIEGIAIESLFLSQIHIITSKRTASASELIINGLKPYIRVVQIGDRTVGKNLASITIHDRDEKGKINPNHTWAMQPIIIQSQNAQGFGDYQNGIVPDIEQIEYQDDLGVLGETSDPLLARTLQVIDGRTSFPMYKRPSLFGDEILFSKQVLPSANLMYIDEKIIK